MRDQDSKSLNNEQEHLQLLQSKLKELKEQEEKTQPTKQTLVKGVPESVKDKLIQQTKQNAQNKNSNNTQPLFGNSVSIIEEQNKTKPIVEIQKEKVDEKMDLEINRN
ncbi:hypothetical protein PPERSA_12813 [Pseudocohnilembus persalinus]|uniref:Uncharacterized protein n=1 Tax=Pseudocohnilembus persalinus TaxID=266149 RepID=A0A0V0QEG5_PSEPJ|nr:hypothetical protein PPERSA_12813 [Pseudocohnilembus persalinus]|eukprot:KRX00594.1 hypothetical protein PPERSA_12813 [Pseudocohnilembus persalinus]